MLFYEQGVGLKSSITADTAFRKDLPCRGVPTVHYRRRMYARNVRVPLTNNAHIRVAPGESTSNPRAGHALGSASSVSTGFGLPVKPHMGTGPSPVSFGPAKKLCPPGPGLVWKQLGIQPAHTHCKCKSAGATTRMYEAR